VVGSVDVYMKLRRIKMVSFLVHPVESVPVLVLLIGLLLSRIR